MNKSSKLRHFVAQNDAVCQNLDKMWKKIVPKKFNRNLNNFFNKHFGQKSIVGINFLIYYPCYEQIIKMTSFWGQNMTIYVKIWTECEKQLWQQNVIIILNNFFNKQFGQKIHSSGQFSYILSMLWTNHQNDVILGPKWRCMSKFGQNVKIKLWQKS